MTVRLFRKKEMDMENVPTNEAPEEIADHSHSEVDQVMVKMQDIENRLAALETKDASGETANVSPAASAGEMGAPCRPRQYEQFDENAFTEKIVKRVKEEIRGVPERETGKKTTTVDPANPPQVPESTHSAPQPKGEAPGGGEIYGKDKMAKSEEETAPKPKSDYDKIAIKKNKLEEAKTLVEKAKLLMKEANEEEDPTRPQPGKTEEKPKPMEMVSPNKTEAAEPEKEEDEEEKEEEEKKEVLKREYENLKKQVLKEKMSKRQSLVGFTSNIEKGGKETSPNQELANVRKASMDTVKEYLKKSGISVV